MEVEAVFLISDKELAEKCSQIQGAGSQCARFASLRFVCQGCLSIEPRRTRQFEHHPVVLAYRASERKVAPLVILSILYWKV